MSTQAPVYSKSTIPRAARIGIVAARFNDQLVSALLEGCIKRLKELGIQQNRVVIERVPGAFEIPVAAKAMCRTKKYSAIICLGAVVRGETPHFDFVAGQCAGGIARVALEEMIPVILGVLTTNNEKQARERLGGKHGHAGRNAAEAAVEMIAVMNRIHSGKRR
jgi:6,7-dimethyl-8-ribityllumazine synthase